MYHLQTKILSSRVWAIWLLQNLSASALAPHSVACIPGSKCKLWFGSLCLRDFLVHLPETVHLPYLFFTRGLRLASTSSQKSAEASFHHFQISLPFCYTKGLIKTRILVLTTLPSSLECELPKYEAWIWLLSTPPTLAGCLEHNDPLINIFRVKECLDGHWGFRIDAMKTYSRSQAI